MEMALVTLVDYLCWEVDRGSVSLLNIVVAFDTINHDILLDHLSRMNPGGNFLLFHGTRYVLPEAASHSALVIELLLHHLSVQ